MKDHLIGQDIDGAMSGISGGERRRVSVGISLVMGAAAIFLDEPTTGLDSESAETLMALLARLARNRGKTVRAPHACRVLDQERLITEFDETLMARLALNRDGTVRSAHATSIAASCKVFCCKPQSLHLTSTDAGLNSPLADLWRFRDLCYFCTTGGVHHPPAQQRHLLPL